ncbi:hypothetical protein BO82DRAFT_5458 [Aspergillus uvarum CBS 121591]|uniref:Secreted protein n=1 Tax=Aspergillus uvarum CBS 121591 TaxID=1448315 RepID=A0A319E804_9EURO|nr:hypothetical protein BO82DRAFT_5458 [Aspergillus uvarum CBS 121591]PYH87212.1 hypothetical protein BO82DRAFT_5458 [Aspergillus uvarum CBS 121591]
MMNVAVFFFPLLTYIFFQQRTTTFSQSCFFQLPILPFHPHSPFAPSFLDVSHLEGGTQKRKETRRKIGVFQHGCGGPFRTHFSAELFYSRGLRES